MKAFALKNIIFYVLLSFLLGLFLIRDFTYISNISLIILFCVAVYYYIKNRTQFNIKSFFPWLFYMTPMLMHLSHAFYISLGNEYYYIETLTLKTAFVFLPFSFAVLPVLPKHKYLLLLFYFLVCNVIFCLGILTNYLLNFNEINESYIHSKILPTPVNHIRFSLMTITSICIAYYLIKEKFSFLNTLLKKYLIGTILFLTLFLHIYSVRSGLFILYFLVFGFGLYQIFIKKQKKIVLISFITSILFILVSYTLFPTFKNKIINTYKDLSSINHEKSAVQNSLGGRLISYQVALSIFCDNPHLGVGVANLKSKTINEYEKKIPIIQSHMIKLPHNEFIRVAVSFGWIGLIVFIISFYATPIYLKSQLSFLFIIQYIITSLSFIIEGTLHTVHGLYYSMIFILLPLYFNKNQNLKN